MTDKIGQIGINPSSLFNTQDILEFAKLLDNRPQVNSIWMPESCGREAFVILAENWHGTKFEYPLKRMKEYVTCFKIISSGETINFDGNFFKLKNMKIM